MDIKLDNLNKTIVNCKKCPRLVKFINKVSKIKRKQNIQLRQSKHIQIQFLF